MIKSYIKHIVLLAVLNVFAAVGVFASKAMSVTMQVMLLDGREVTVCLHGDENVSFYKTPDGEIIIRNGDDFRTATLEEIEKIRISQAELEQNKQEAMAKAVYSLAANNGEGLRGTRLFPHLGTPRVPVIIVNFADLALTYSKDDIDSLLNGKSTLQEKTNVKSYGSVFKYFHDCSDGLFGPQFDVYGPYTLPFAMAYYGVNSNDGLRKDINISSFIKHACNVADDDIDFSNYDSNNDGYVDLVYIVYAGYGENAGANTNCIWAKSGHLEYGGTYDGKQLYRYGVNAEKMGNETFPEHLTGIGLFCHEFSHTMGLPDFYPTIDLGDYSNYDNQSMEDWDLMDNGENSMNGCWPPMYTAFEKELMGWQKIDTLSNPADVILKPLMHGGNAYRILNDDDPTGNEYWIVEALSGGKISQRWHAYLRGKGMLVTHVNYNPNAFTLASNTVNNSIGKPGITIIPADGYLPTSYRASQDAEKLTSSEYMTYSAFYAELSGDPYPGSQGITEFNNYKAYTGTVDKPITDIVQNDDFTVTFKFMGGTPPLMGDVNGDGYITMADANMVVNYFLADETSKPAEGFNIDAADVNEDGTITMADANAIVNKFLGE